MVQNAGMTSWRDLASQQAQDDLDGLVNTVLPLATQLLNEAGEFYPFGATVGQTGNTEMVMGHPGTGGDNPASSDTIDFLVKAFRGKSAEIRALALVANVRTAEYDAVRVDLEHRDGHAIAVLLPYKAIGPPLSVEYFPLRAGAGNPRVWNDEHSV